MTESEFLTSEDPVAMLACMSVPTVASGKCRFPPPSDRKLRLLHSATDRIDLSFAPPTTGEDELRQRRLILAKCNAIDQYADGLCSAADVMRARHPDRRFDDSVQAQDAFTDLVNSLSAPGQWLPGAGKKMADAVRDIVGNPFRPVRLGRECDKCNGKGTRMTHLYDAGGEAYDTIPVYCKPCLGTGRIAERDWLTPTVLSLAEAAYAERPGRKCAKCAGKGRVKIGIKGGPEQGPKIRYVVPPPEDKECWECHGTGRIDDGSLDPVRLAILADALEEAGCIGDDPCPHCYGKGFHETGMVRCDIYGIHDTRQKIDCVACNRGKLPHPILSHLRSPGVHVRGMWSLDLVLGKE